MNSQTLQASRDSLLADLDAMASVVREDQVDDGYGGLSVDTTPLVATYPARVRIQNVQPREGAVGGATQSSRPYVVDLPWDADVKPKDVLLVGSETLQIVGTNALESNRMLLHADCVKLS